MATATQFSSSLSPVLLKRPTVSGASLLSKTALYEAIKQGTFPPPVKLAKRCVAWPKQEVDKWLFAKCAGYSDQQMRDLIKSMLDSRTSQSLQN